MEAELLAKVVAAGDTLPGCFRSLRWIQEFHSGWTCLRKGPSSLEIKETTLVCQPMSQTVILASCCGAGMRNGRQSPARLRARSDLQGSGWRLSRLHSSPWPPSFIIRSQHIKILVKGILSSGDKNGTCLNLLNKDS